MNTEDIVVDLIALNDGQLLGRNRLQRQAYLLHRCGAEFNMRFVYYRYAPHSFELANGVIEACADQRIEIERSRGRHGIDHAIFKTGKEVRHPDNIGCLSSEHARRLIAMMEQVSDTVLELAATIVFLRDERGRGARAVTETRARKPLKAQSGRLEGALTLVRRLGLDGSAVQAGFPKPAAHEFDTPGIVHDPRPDVRTHPRAAG